MANPYGRFIVIDGIDIAAREYASVELSRWLKSNRVHNILIKDPTGQDEANVCVSDAIAKFSDKWGDYDRLMFEFIMRRRYLTETVQKAISSYYWVICNGFMDSVYADYVPSQRIVHGVIHDLEEIFLEGLPVPDHVYVVDTPLSVAHKRAAETPAYQEDDTLKAFEKVYRSSYQRKRTEYLIRATAQRTNHTVIEGNKSLEQIYEDIKTFVQEILPQTIKQQIL